jgi:hypothetical protein
MNASHPDATRPAYADSTLVPNEIPRAVKAMARLASPSHAAEMIPTSVIAAMTWRARFVLLRSRSPGYGVRSSAREREGRPVAALAC